TTGYLGLFLAADVLKYATAIWIPSGIALGSVLVWGKRALLDVFLGSLIIYFYITQHNEPSLSFWLPLFIGGSIAIGATLQAAIGYHLIKRWVGLQNPLNTPRDILLFAILSG